MLISMEEAIARPRQRSGGGERRRERRYDAGASCATAMLLGDEDSRSQCRILNTSRTGMRILVESRLPEGSQVQVEWEGKFFIGTICYRFAKGDRWVVGLKLVTCNYGKLPGKVSFAFGLLWTFFRVETVRLLGGSER